MSARDRRGHAPAGPLERAIADAVDDDPYRSGQQTGVCPRCQNETASDGELNRLVCVRGCGEWYSKDLLDRLLLRLVAAHGAVDGRTAGDDDDRSG